MTADSAGRNRLHLVLLSALVLLYLVLSLRHLTVVPPVYEDEPWQASTGLSLARHGVFGSDLFRGLDGMERRYYGYLPVHPILLAATYRLAGFGLRQTRLEAVSMGLLTLLLTYALGRRLFDATVGLVAVAILLLARTAGLTPSQPTGILLTDLARIARYDIVVPVFGLASLHAFLSAEARRRSWLFACAGLLAALAGLSHVYGAGWFVVLALLALWNRTSWRSIAALAVGFAVPWGAYLVYVIGDLTAWSAQTRGYAPRFGLTSPAWYWRNLLHEPQRYGPGLGPLGWSVLLRPGFWGGLLVLPISLAALARHAVGHDRRARPARALLVPAIVLPSLFALLITFKLANYLATVVPIAALTAAWGGMSAWRWAGRAPAPHRWARAALAAVAALVAIEGASRYVALERAAAQTTPYADFIARVRAAVPPGARILGLHNYWFGLDDFDYRSFVVPLSLSDPGTPPARVPSLAEALDTVDPTVVLLGDRMRAFLAEPGQENRHEALGQWLAANRFVRAATIDDATYGRIDVYQRVDR